MHWQTSRFTVDLSTPVVMGIVNVTPDSFSDGGQYATTRAAVAHCEALLSQGAGILDIGAESTRPGAQPVPQALELARLLPVVREAVKLGVPVSVDSYKPAVMQAVLDLGADIINDIWALRWRDPAARENALAGAQVVSAYPGCGICLMHMQGEPQTMQICPMPGDEVMPKVLTFLEHSVQNLQGLGVQKARIAVDPGIGFGKTVRQNFSLLRQQEALRALGCVVLAGWSRKSSLAAVAPGLPGLDATQARLVPSVVAALLAVQHGAHVVRVHDVHETVQALKVWQAMALG